METKQEEKPRPRCPNCTSRVVSKYGIHITRRHNQAVKNQRYQCQNCGHQFYREIWVETNEKGKA